MLLLKFIYKMLNVDKSWVSSLKLLYSLKVFNLFVGTGFFLKLFFRHVDK